MTASTVAEIAEAYDVEKIVLNGVELKLPNGQLKPEFANSIDECTDTSKLYVLPDGYIYAYTMCTGAAYTNVADPTADDWVAGMRFSTTSEVSATNSIQTNAFKVKPGDTLYIKGLDIYSLIDGVQRPRYAVYKNGNRITNIADYSDERTTIDNGYGTKNDNLDYFTLQLVKYNGGSYSDDYFDSIRLGGALVQEYSEEDVIITVNEEIKYVSEHRWSNTGHAFIPADYEDRILDLEKETVDHETRLTLLEANDGSGVPEYWLEELETKADTIQQAMETAGRNKSAFLWYTDAHWTAGNSKMSPDLLNYLCKNTSMTKVNFGGDIIGDPSELTHDTVKHLCSEWRKRLKGLRHHSVIGNHDNIHKGRNDSELSKIVYSFLVAPEESSDMVIGGDLYYYVDDQCERTRYLYLDSGRFSLSDDETKFIIDALTTTLDGWHIVVISHIWFQYTATSAPTVGAVNGYMQKLLDLFDAYNARQSGAITMVSVSHSYDFTDANGKIEFCIGGHIHVDYDFTSNGGIPVIITASDANQSRGTNATACGTIGTITESAVFGIIADYANNKITVVGVGRGTSREILLNTT